MAHAATMTDGSFQCALVTGAARRIGRAMALELAAYGWAVVVHYNTSGDAARAVAAEITEHGGSAMALQADLTRDDDVAGLVGRAAEAIGPITCLINNASVFGHDTAETVTRESWDVHMQVNLRAPFVLCQDFSAGLPDGIEGNIINMIDQRVWNLTPYFTSYTVSKSALWTLTRTLALAFAPRIRVNAIGPGPTLKSAHQTEEQFMRQWLALPLHRRVTPLEICEAVRFILDAPAMTGQMIALDGGQHLGWTQPSDDGVSTD